MKYLICYDVHDSGEHPEVYASMKDCLKERFGLLVKCTESVYLFENEEMDPETLKLEIWEILDFVPDLEFHVFQLTDKLDVGANLKYCRAILERQPKLREFGR